MAATSPPRRADSSGKNNVNYASALEIPGSSGKIDYFINGLGRGSVLQVTT
jgi:hypothetical protein